MQSRSHAHWDGTTDPLHMACESGPHVVVELHMTGNAAADCCTASQDRRKNNMCLF